MNLPNAGKARVEREKIVDYLLNREHSDGSSKAAFFARFGFRAADWRKLADALRNQAIESPVADVVSSSYGTRYIVDGPRETPTDEQPHVHTVWVVDRETETPIRRLVTAYPHAP